MQNYFQINGLVYQLVPILNTAPNDGTMGRLNTDIMYDNLMNKFKWGGMDKPGIYLDETILRQTKNLRNLFYRLAIKLVEEGDNAKAIKVLDRCLAVMPKENVPYDIFVVRLAEAYYAAGAAEKANNLIKEVANNSADKYRYFSSFRKAGKGGLVQNELQENEQIMGYCMQIAEINKQDVLAKELKGQMDQLMR
jgi:tetratricopeptide (TPR) repeat protein